MSYTEPFRKSLTVTANATLSADYVDMGKGYRKVYLEVPTMTSSTSMQIYGCVHKPTETQTYRTVYESVATDKTTYVAATVSSSVTNGLCEIPGGYQCYKVRLISTQASDITFNFYGTDG